MAWWTGTVFETAMLRYTVCSIMCLYKFTGYCFCCELNCNHSDFSFSAALASPELTLPLARREASLLNRFPQSAPCLSNINNWYAATRVFAFVNCSITHAKDKWRLKHRIEVLQTYLYKADSLCFLLYLHYQTITDDGVSPRFTSKISGA